MHETAGFQDGSEPGATVVPWTETGYACSRDVETINADGSRVLVIAMFRFVRIRVSPCIFATTYFRNREGTRVFVQSVHNRLEDNTVRYDYV